MSGLNPKQKAEAATILTELERRQREERGRTFKPVKPSDPNDFGVTSNDQWGFFHSTADERWVFGGNRSGKTEVAVNDCDMFCRGVHPVRTKHCQPPVKVRYVAPKWRDGVLGVVLQKFKEIVPRNALRGGKWQTAWSEKEHRLYYDNGSFIHFKSGEEDLNTYGGADLDAVYQDEHIDESRYKENAARLVERNGFFVSSMTPELGVTWEEDHVTNPPPGFSVDYWFFTTYGNPYLSKEGVEKLEGKIRDPKLRDTKLRGMFVPLQGMVIPHWNERLSVIPDRKLHPDAYRVFCIDFHRKVPAAAMWAAWEPCDDGTMQLVIYRCIKRKATVPEWKRIIREESAGEKIHQWLGDEPDGGDTKDFRNQPSALNEFHEGSDPIPIVQVKKTPGTFNASVYRLWDMCSADPVSRQPKLFVFRSADHGPIYVDGKVHGSLPWELKRWTYKSEKKADEENLREQVRQVNDHYISDLRYIVLNGPGSVGDGPSVVSSYEGSWE